MKLQLQHIIDIISPVEVIGDSAHSNTCITRFLIDSRSLDLPDGVMFCAIRTDAADGHRFISQLYDKGVRYFLVETIPADVCSMPDALFVKVMSVETAIWQIAEARRNRAGNNTKYIAITGSVAKTTLKEMLYQALVGKTNVQRSPRSWNSLLGVPLSMLEIDDDADIAIIEVGIDRPGDMERLAALVRPDFGILTPLTSEHDAGFESRSQKIQEKLKLFADCEYVRYDSIDDISGILIKFGFDTDVNVFPPENRIGVHEGNNDCVIVCDGFTNDLRSLEFSLDFMRRRMTTTRSNTLVLRELIDRNLDYAALAEMIRRYGIERIIAIGMRSENVIHFEEKFRTSRFDTVNDFLRISHIDDFSHETVTVFGFEPQDMERLCGMLESPRHDTIFEINLQSIVHNFNYYRSKLKPSTGLVAMVKASAYGTGAVEVAKTLQAQGAAYLAVAVIDEGVELRRGGITMPIIVLNPITGNYKTLFDYNLEPSVFSLQELETLCEEGKKYGVDAISVHIKLDTGMHRVGFIESELPALIDRLKSDGAPRVVSIFSHLATADCPDQNEYTQMQLDIFEKMSSHIVDSLDYPVKRHILNTAGIARYPEHQYDLVRLGIGLYGISPIDDNADLRTVAALRSTIISIKSWAAGTTVGYARRGLLARDSVIATVPIGYADGLDRHLSRGNTSFIVRGGECKTVGNICMDQCMIDVTDVPGVQIGDSVEIFGPQMPVTRLSDTLGTIPYEILTSVSPRVRRIYFRD